ncbi:MAG: FtsX-like permease family protein [Lentisphaeria bacterium]
MSDISKKTGHHEIEALPMRKIIGITCKGIKLRLWRSLIVVSGIVLAIAFLSYILCSDGFMQNAINHGSAELLKRLSKAGVKVDDVADQRIQTYWMVALALLISFVGIVNAMLMSVTERFREIGTMKCLGALDGFVLKMFLIESAIEGSVGAVLGMLVGVSLAYLEGSFVFGDAVWGLLPPWWLATATGGSFVAGILITIMGALYPARQAAKMMPVVALRAEL